MIDREHRPAIALTLSVAILIALSFLYQRGPKNRGMSAPTAQLDDSIAFTAPTHDSTTKALARAVSGLAAADQRLASAARSSQARANRERARADSLAAAAELAAGDADAWRLAHNARLAETVELRWTIDTLTFRVDTLTAARDSARRAWKLEQERGEALDRLRAGLKEDLRKATECTIAFGIRCPSRKETAVAVILIDRGIQLAEKLASRK